jgi:hypothetical protein
MAEAKAEAQMANLTDPITNPILSYSAAVEETDKLVDDKFQVKRCMDNGSCYCHSKTICVDSKLLYVGSDNTYPCHNEEHGVWVEYPRTVDAWFKTYWTPFWGCLTPAKN